MSARGVGFILLLLGSEALGIAYGQWSFHLFKQTVPQVALSAFNQSAAQVAFMVSGAVLGLAIFIYALLAIYLARIFGKPRAS